MEVVVAVLDVVVQVQVVVDSGFVEEEEEVKLSKGFEPVRPS